MQQIHDRLAGLEVHRDSVLACFRHPGPRGAVVREKERFTTTTAGLEVLEAWLADRDVQLVAMEATGVYWKPVLYALERRFMVWLCNARAVKRSPAASPISPMPSGWPMWPLTGWSARASCRRCRSASCAS